MSAPQVYAAIKAVMEGIGQAGIAKARKNQQQGYSFRGIDDVYNELNGLLAANNLVMAPRILSREVVERQTVKGSPLFYVTLEAEFDLISADDGSKHTVRVYGEAMDSADKATNKAMSAAYKYAAMMLFCIPTQGDNDADAVTHDVAPKRISAAAMKRGLVDIDNDLLDCASVGDVNKCAKVWAEIMARDGWSDDFRDVAIPKFAARREAIAAAAQPGAGAEDDVFPGDLPSKFHHPIMAG